MNESKVLLVEDILAELDPRKKSFEDSGWEVVPARDPPSAINELEKVLEEGKTFNAIVTDLGLPPKKDDPNIGVDLIGSIRNIDPDIPILAYTALPPTAENVNYSQMLRKLLEHGTSFVYTRQLPENVTLVRLLDIVSTGLIVIGPTAKRYLSRSIPSIPDPLDENLWKTLRKISEGKNYAEAAIELPDVAKEGVRARIRKIREILLEKQLIEEYENQLEDLRTWYRNNHVRYCR